ncbi:MAG: hypothetical protein HY842_03615 [Bacteroidetes bacterium]|nr:hypothetical protein [Bacteroidota bacterium]
MAGHFWLLLPMMFGAMGNLSTQTTWTGSSGTDWATASNWSAGVPDAADDVTINDVTNDPTLSTAGAVAKSVTVNGGGVLTITAAGVLGINGATGEQGLRNNSGGTVTNSGTITIGATASNGTFGILSYGTFNNNSGGFINIDRSTESGLRPQGGTFTNEGTINIGVNFSVGNNGLNVNGSSTFNNNTGGVVNIDRSTEFGINNSTSGSFTNNATIIIGANASVGTYGIRNFSTFNNTGGAINIDRSTTSGISLNSSTLTNSATLTIGALVAMTNLITSAGGTFSNSTGGTLKGTGNLPASNFTNAGGTLAPGYSAGIMTFNASEDFSNSTMSIEVIGAGGVAGTDFDKIAVTGTATLGGTSTLNLVFSYAAVNGFTYDILAATTVSGAITNVSFSNTGAGNVTGVSLSYPGGNTVRVTVSSPLPVELVNFTARLIPLSGRTQGGGSILLDWQTASEQNNQGFEIQRSTDGQRWDKLGFVAGNGTSTAEHEYVFWDEKPLPGVNYYRLHQMDFDGNFEYSPIVTVEMGRIGGGITLFPNPASGTATFALETNYIGEATLALFDPMGRRVKTQALSLEGGAFRTGLELSGLLAGCTCWR